METLSIVVPQNELGVHNGGFTDPLGASTKKNKFLALSTARMSMTGGKWFEAANAPQNRESPMLQVYIRPKAKAKRTSVIADNQEKI